jgi:hypothetical protein
VDLRAVRAAFTVLAVRLAFAIVLIGLVAEWQAANQFGNDLG